LTLTELNVADHAQARQALLRCCGSDLWTKRMLDSRPFSGSGHLHATAEAIWRELGCDDWLQAFSTHPKVGERNNNTWSAQEQRGMAEAPIEAAENMARLNEQYEAKFGWIYIVCATGKSASQMLADLTQRLSNTPEAELPLAAAEQEKIMHLRLDKLLSQ
jgi:2-oxo-4-hydroxy-4-carboxy-5-ureidoimidazoline decarboxylase